MKQELETQIEDLAKELFGYEAKIDLTRPDERYGDYATNVALQIASQGENSPRDIAEAIAAKLRDKLKATISRVDVAGPGFINLTLSDEALNKAIDASPSQPDKDQEVIVEFGDPNPFKEMHLGHLYTAIVGDSIARLLEASGASVERVSYHGDIGLHIAKAIWAINKQAETNLKTIVHDPSLIGQFYATGATAYDNDELAKAEINEINKHIYAHDDKTIEKIYLTGKDLSFKHFDAIFDDIQISFNKRYFESETSSVGLKIVQANIGKVFSESEGATVFKGEEHGLHTRVFINSKGLPTYETKDLGLAELKNRDYPKATQSIIITDHQQAEYFKVMLAALSLIKPRLAQKTKHLVHGHLGLTTGKMSSRSGQVFAASQLIGEVNQAVKQHFPDTKVQHDIYLAALRYSFLKYRIGSDVIFDVKESVTLEGNSGPYLQYAHARAQSILSNAGANNKPARLQFEPGERSLARKLTEYPEVINRAVSELLPHHITTYLYELAQSFNRFYEQNRVIGDKRQEVRLQLVAQYANKLRAGLKLLGIPAPDKM